MKNEFIVDNEKFWHSRQWLQYVHDDAKFRRLNPFALLLAVMARLSALTPPNVTVQVSPHDRPMSLNLNVVLVGAAGTGKGKTLREARVFCFNVFSAGSSVFFRSVGGWFSPVSSSCSQ
jgi:hypothetical protein